MAVAPDHSDWVYKIGEEAKFTVTVTQNSEPVQNVKISYSLGLEMMTPVKNESAILKDGKLLIPAGTLKEPGFLRCRVFAEFNGIKYEGLGTAAFNPELIKPTIEYPADFMQFWEKAKQDLARFQWM